MKDIFKSVVGKIISIVLIVVIIGIGGFLGYKKITEKISLKVDHNTTNSIEIVKEKLENTAQLNTGSYLCTDVLTRRDSKEIKGWKIPLTEKSFIVSYDGVVRAGIKDLSKAQIYQNGDTIIVKLPKVEITAVEIDNNSFKKLDQSNNIFNPITIDDLNDAQKELKSKMENRAIEKGILEMAQNNAEEILEGILKGANDDFELKIEWQT